MQLESEVIQAEGGIVVFALKGRLIAGPRLTIAEAQVKSIVKQGATKLVLDLEQVEHADSSGFCLLLHAYTAVSAIGGQLRIAAPSKRLLDLFQLTETDRLLTICADRTACIQSLKRKSASKNDQGIGPIQASNTRGGLTNDKQPKVPE
jgi:anti-sigma B factor antagonist